MKLNGDTVEWWGKEKFQNREIVITTLGKDGNTEQHISIPNDRILCDLCGDDIMRFPIPVISNNALCGRCYNNYGGNYG